MYHVEMINIKPDNPFFAFCCNVTNKSKNMFNVANFYIRNIMTGLKKDESQLTTNEKEVLKIVAEAIAEANKNNANKGKSKQFALPTSKKWFLGYGTLDAIFKESNNTDYRSTHIHTVQNAIKDCVEAWKSYFKVLKTYKAGKPGITGIPKIPGYCKNDNRTATLSNAAAFIKDKKLRIPYAKAELDVSAIPHASTDKLIEVKIIPYYGMYQIQIVTDDLIQECEPIAEIPDGVGIMAVDSGVDNFATIADNKGNIPVVIKGGYIKAVNQLFNKTYAKLKGILMYGHDPKTYHPKATKGMYVISRKRDARLKDFFYKTAHYICRTAQSRDIEYIIIGKNIGWKQDANLGHKNNQEFVQIPHAKFFNVLITVSRKYGIHVIIQEESYSSKASFIDNDNIPTYKEGEERKYTFSGKRVCRGLYKSKNGTFINADVNGAANILKKNKPNAFDSISKDYLYKTTQAVYYCKGKVSPATGSRGCVSTPLSA